MAVWEKTHTRGMFPSVLENRGLTDPAEIEQALRFGEYIKNGTPMIKSNPFFDVFFFVRSTLTIFLTETLALYSLRKYRYLKRRYN